jgi:hypothetical protein
VSELDVLAPLKVSLFRSRDCVALSLLHVERFNMPNIDKPWREEDNGELPKTYHVTEQLLRRWKANTDNPVSEEIEHVLEGAPAPRLEEAVDKAWRDAEAEQATMHVVQADRVLAAVQAVCVALSSLPDNEVRARVIAAAAIIFGIEAEQLHV